MAGSSHISTVLFMEPMVHASRITDVVHPADCMEKAHHTLVAENLFQIKILIWKYFSSA